MPSVIMTRSGPLVRLCPWVKAIEPLLEYDYIEFNGGFSGEKRALYFLDGDCGYFPAGFQQPVGEALSRMGIETSLVDERDRGRLFRPFQWGLISELRAGQKEVLNAILAHDHGQIVCATGFGKSFLIGELIRGLPDSRFIVTAPGISETRNLYSRLKDIVPADELGLLGAGSKDPPDRRVTVAVSRSLHKADFEHCDLFLFDEAHMCGHNTITHMLLTRLGDSRNYGFTATPKGRSDKSDKVIESVFGQPIAEFDYSDCVTAGNVTPIDVIFYDVPGDVQASKSPFGNKLVQNKRRFYWRNEVRNLTIAAVCRSLPETEHVLVMVDSVDHLLHLAALLPEYALVYGDGNDLAKRAAALRITLMNRHSNSKEEHEKIYEEFRNGSIRRVIATGVYKQAVDFPLLSVLVRADGSPSPILSSQIPGRLSRLSKGKGHGVLVDFRDLFNSTAKGHYHARLKNYRKNGWSIDHRGDILSEEG